jgi:DNA polymerase
MSGMKRVLSTAEKQLAQVASEVVVCIKCPLSKSRTKAVPGVGDSKAQIMFIGEAPGKSEDAKGEPFVGAAGKFLDVLLSEIGLSREQVFITNIVKCRPPGNREPEPFEIETCTPYLHRQIKTIRPKFIVTLGKNSSAHIYSMIGTSFRGITQVHGKPFKAELLGLEVTVFPTFHPAAALYNGKCKEQLIEDFKLLGQEVNSEVSLTS